MSQRIVIVGAGFVGVRTATLLRRLAPGEVDVVLIDAKETFLFAPRLIDALAGQTDGAYQTAKLKTLASKHHFRFVQGIVTNLDQHERRVFIAKPVTNEITPLPYDWLVLAQGANTNYFGIPGAEAYAFPFKSSDHITAIHHRAQDLLNLATQETDVDAQQRLLSFVVVGGGPTGIEAVCALRTYVLKLARELYADFVPLISFTLVQAAPQILIGFPLHVVQKTIDELTRQNIRIIIGDPVVKVTERFLLTTQNQRIDSALVLWCAGIQSNGVTCFPTLHYEPNGCLVTNHFLQSSDRIFAAGDGIIFRDRNVTVPKNAQTAMLMANTLADNILHAMRNQPLKPFHYRSKGNLITLGETGIIDLKAFSIKTSLTPWVRDLVYRYRFEQLVK